MRIATDKLLFLSQRAFADEEPEDADRGFFSESVQSNSHPDGSLRKHRGTRWGGFARLELQPVTVA